MQTQSCEIHSCHLSYQLDLCLSENTWRENDLGLKSTLSQLELIKEKTHGFRDISWPNPLNVRSGLFFNKTMSSGQE